MHRTIKRRRRSPHLIATVLLMISSACDSERAEPTYKGKVLGEWIALIDDGHPETRRDAFAAVIEMGIEHPRVVETVEEGLRHSDAEIQRQAMQYVWNLREDLNPGLGYGAGARDERLLRGLAALFGEASDVHGKIARSVALEDESENDYVLFRHRQLELVAYAAAIEVVLGDETRFRNLRRSIAGPWSHAAGLAASLATRARTDDADEAERLEDLIREVKTRLFAAVRAESATE